MDHPYSKITSGLTDAEAGARLRREGFNELPSQARLSNFRILLKVLQEPMLFLLVAAGLIYLVLGDISDASLLVGGIIVILGITFYQEHKTERTLEALRRLSSPVALVIRDGVEKHIPGREVVTGDFVIIREGDRIPADGVILSATNLLADESLLTGESIPVQKTVWDGKEKMERPGGDNLPFVFSGTLVTRGHALSLVTATGAGTQMGKIGVSLKNTREGDTLLKLEIKRLIRIFAFLGLSVCLIVVIFYGVINGNWLLGLLAGLTLSMSLIPEEFSVVLVVFLTLGAWRIAKRKVLTRNSAAIETLGAVNVLCVDKTGTLTQNKIQLKQLVVGDKSIDLETQTHVKLPEEFKLLAKYAALAGQEDPFDPLEKEIKLLEEKFLNDHHKSAGKLVREYPFSKTLMAITHVWQTKAGFVVAVKGAPEAIVELCRLNNKDEKKYLDQIHSMTKSGLRVLGVAKAVFTGKVLPDNPTSFAFQPLGMLGFADSIRSGIAQSVRESYEAGVRVIMITGDYPATAQFIAKQAGLDNPEEVITGPELSGMNHLELRERIKTVNIFARVIPEQKLDIVNALKANDEIVAMTGDGVNDAPALKSANIGIAMGQRGTDVAREASDIVLLNDDFSSIVAAVKMGRQIFDNLKKAVVYIAAVHVPIAGIALLPLLFQFPIILLPAHIAFLELIIDPACSIVFESEPAEDNIMRRPPRNIKAHLLNRKALMFSLFQSLFVLFILGVVFLVINNMGKDINDVRTVMFVTLVLANLLLITTNLSWSKNVLQNFLANRALQYVIIGTLLSLVVIISSSFLRGLFHFSSINWGETVIIMAAAATVFCWFEALKWWRNRSVLSAI